MTRCTCFFPLVTEGITKPWISVAQFLRIKMPFAFFEVRYLVHRGGIPHSSSPPLLDLLYHVILSSSVVISFAYQGLSSLNTTFCLGFGMALERSNVLLKLSLGTQLENLFGLVLRHHLSTGYSCFICRYFAPTTLRNKSERAACTLGCLKCQVHYDCLLVAVFESWMRHRSIQFQLRMERILATGLLCTPGRGMFQVCFQVAFAPCNQWPSQLYFKTSLPHENQPAVRFRAKISKARYSLAGRKGSISPLRLGFLE